MAIKPGTLLLIGGGIAAAYFISKATSTGTAVKKLQFRNPKIKFGKVSLFSTTATITMDVWNPTSTSVPVDYLAGDILYKGKSLATFSVDGKATKLQAKAQATTSITFDVVIKTTGAINVILSLINGTLSQIIDVQGIFYAMGSDLNFSFSYDVIKGRLITPGVSGKASVNGIAGVEAKLQFSSNAEMEKYFGNRRASKKLMFSKN